MAAAYDILLGADGDLPIEQQNFTIGLSDNQHIEDAFDAFPGQWKQYPQNGIGILAYQLARVNPPVVSSKVRQQLTGDGYVCNPAVSLLQGVLKVIPKAYRL